MQLGRATGGGLRGATRLVLLLFCWAVVLLAGSAQASAGEYVFDQSIPIHNTPYGIEAAASGDIYATGFQGSVWRVASDGTFITAWGSFGAGNGQFNQPWGIATDATGAVYVADVGNNRIQKFTASGTFVTKWGSAGTGDGQFSNPQDIDVDAAGFVYVTDTGNHRVEKFDSAGNFVTKWGSLGGGDNQFSRPQGLAVGPGGVVYVGDSDTGRIKKYDSSGNFLTKWGGAGTGPGQFDAPIWGLDTDASGNVYATAHNSNNCVLQKFSSAGTLLGSTCETSYLHATGSDVSVEPAGSLAIAGEGQIPARYVSGSRLTIRLNGNGSGDVDFTVGGGLSPSNFTLSSSPSERAFVTQPGTFSVAAESSR